MLMARGGASIESGTVQNIIPRFVAKEWFIETALERNMYLSLLSGALENSDWRCFSYALMSSHIHLGLIAGRNTLASWLRPMHTLFARWMNEQRERIGAVFVRDPNVIAVQPDGISRLINYIHNNPVRAGVVANPALSDWTSHRAYAGQSHRPAWLDIESGLARSGFTDLAALTDWTQSTTVEREELEAFHVVPPPKVGRPKKSLPQPSRAGERMPEVDAAYRISRVAYRASRGPCSSFVRPAARPLTWQGVVTYSRGYACRASVPSTDRAIDRALHVHRQRS
jgi:hypothetical protein